jgi:hypothetical protein
VIDLPPEVATLYEHATGLDGAVRSAKAQADSAATRLDDAQAELTRFEISYKHFSSDESYAEVEKARSKFDRAKLDHAARVDVLKEAQRAHATALATARMTETTWLRDRVSQDGWREELERAGLAEFLQCQRRSLEIIAQLHDAANLTEERGRRLAELTGKAVTPPDKEHLRFYLRRLVGAVWDSFDSGWRSNRTLGYYLDRDSCALLPSREWDADAPQRADAKRLLGESHVNGT